MRAACGLIGPIVFTSAWVVGERRQAAYSVRDEHISGLAAPDADAPHLMTAGFLTLGVCTLAFADELHRRLGRDGGAGWGPALLGLSGAAAIVAGLFRRDRRSNFPPPGTPPGQSWVNDVHDIASAAGNVAGIVGTLLLAHRFRDDPEWAPLHRAALGSAASSLGLMSYFASETTRPWNGVVQRAGITIPLAFMAAAALRMLRSPGQSRGARIISGIAFAPSSR